MFFHTFLSKLRIFFINLEFVRAIKPPHIVLVHGEANEMARIV